jgi:peptidoglycan hydrolase CwlO-like protein
VAALSLYAGAVEDGGVELAKYRIPDLWQGMLMAGFQLTETDVTGENYTMVGDDTDSDGILKHNVSWGAGREHGVAPVLAASSSFDGDGNWTIAHGGQVDTEELMDAALLFLELDAAWFTTAGDPIYTEEYATMLLLWTDAELVAWMEARRAEIDALNDQVSALQDALANTSGNVTDLLNEIKWLKENMTAMQLDLNDSLENETVFRNQTLWLREKLEETNGTVDNLTKEIEILESKVSRIEQDLVERDENVTALEVDLRAVRFNATELQWELDNASAALTQAELDLEAAERERDDTDQDLEDAESRLFMTAIISIIAGMVTVVIILKLMRKL